MIRFDSLSLSVYIYIHNIITFEMAWNHQPDHVSSTTTTCEAELRDICERIDAG